MISRWVALTALIPVAFAQAPIPAGDWPRLTRDLANTKYSPLNQINTANVSQLKTAWTYRLRGEAPGGRGGASGVTPIVVNGIMYLTASGAVHALEADTGKEIWNFAAQGVSARGVAYWPGDEQNPPRIIFTGGGKITALNANTGKIDPGFGKEGVVEMGVPYNSPPAVYKNTLIVGAASGEQPAKGPAGNTRAFSAKTGAKMWEFTSVAQKGTFGGETWPDGEAEGRQGVNNWGFYLTVDEQRGIVYSTFGSPASDYYGGDRKGDNLFGNSVVALNAESGQRLWHFQAVHHDIWDYDLPPGPTLVDIRVNGQVVPALAQTGKVGYMYILNRVTGQPIFGIDETPVPQSQVPGEFTSMTQPIPRLPEPLGRHEFDLEKDLVRAEDTTPAHAQACADLVARSGPIYNEGPFTPWVYRPAGQDPRTSIIFPGAIGGNDWGGMAADPRTGYIFVNTSDYASIGWIEPMGEGARVPYDQRSVLGQPVPSKFWASSTNAQGERTGSVTWPCQRPPWGHLQAIDANTGKVAWKVVFGVSEELPEGKQQTGRINGGAPIATAGGLVFIGATNDKHFRAYNSRTGQLLWDVKLDYDAIATPMTFQGKNGKQYVAITAAGGLGITSAYADQNERIYVFALP
jgi:quinoprotein glucose dehydrogenase